jgi:hypothetical protein
VCFLSINPCSSVKSKHRAEIVTMLEETLKSHKNKSATKKWAIALPASSRYKRYLTITSAGNIKIDRNAITQAATCRSRNLLARTCFFFKATLNEWAIKNLLFPELIPNESYSYLAIFKSFCVFFAKPN